MEGFQESEAVPRYHHLWDAPLYGYRMVNNYNYTRRTRNGNASDLRTTRVTRTVPNASEVSSDLRDRQRYLLVLLYNEVAFNQYI